MPRCNRRDGEACPPLMSSQVGDICTRELMEFWDSQSMQQRKELLSVDKRELFQTIRSKYCSRCFGLFHLRWDELKSARSDNPCPACSEYFCSLQVQLDGNTLTLEDSIVERQPFTTFAEAKRRERERLLQYAGTGVLICGNEWTRSPGNSMCNLHTSNVPVEALIEYWTNLPDEHRTALFQLRDEDFAAELDAQLKYQLRICKDCRGNVTRAFRDLRAKAGAPGEDMEICDGHNLSIADGVVMLLGEGDPAFFERAEEVEDFKAEDGDVDDGYSEGVRHAETPELAREALADCAILIFKGQVEVAFREQTAGHNALLLFVHLALTMMEARLDNAFKDLTAKKAEAELMEMVAKDGAKEPKKAKKKAKKKAGKGDGKGEAVLCGCGAVCDQCDQCSQRSKSPVRGTPSLPIQASKSPQASLEMYNPDDGDSRQTQQQHGNKEPPLQSPSRSILGADLVSTPRQSSLAEGLGVVAASPEASWETIPAGGKGRRSFTGGGRRSSAEQPAAHAPRAVVAELGPKRAVPSSGAQHVQHAIRAAAVAASPAQQHRASVQQQQESPTLGHQPRHHVRAMPVSNMPSANSRAGWHGLSPASSLSLSEAQSPSAGSPASSHLMHMAHRQAPARVGPHLGRPSESAAPVSKQDPQIAWKGSNPWHSRAAADMQATCGGGKLFDQPVHAVHAFSIAWPPPPPPPQQAPSSQGFHDAFSLFYHSPLARQSSAAEGETSSVPGANQPPYYNLWGPSMPSQQARMPLLHVVR